MRLRSAFIRGIRAGIGAFVATNAGGMIAAVKDFTDLKQRGLTFLLSIVLGFCTFVVMFVWNTLEDNISWLRTPKG